MLSNLKSLDMCAYSFIRELTTQSMLEHFQDLQLRPQSQRLQTLELLNGLMLSHRSALKELGDEALVGLTDLVSGEKDPRNLMIIFSLLKVLSVEWDISRHAEAGVWDYLKPSS